MFKEMFYVYAVYQERSFTRAAQKLFLSQPTLSTMVKRAENRIGAPIFDRSTTPISLTPAGQYYIDQAQKIMKIHQDTANYFNLFHSSDPRQLRLGGSSFFLSYIYPSVVNRFKKQFGDIAIFLIELRNIDMISRLMNDTIDFFIEVDDMQHEYLDRVILGEERVIFAVPSAWSINDQLTAYRYTSEDIQANKGADIPPVDPSVFAQCPFILLQEGNDSFRRAVDICHGAGFTPKVSMTTNQVLTSYYLAAEGHGISLIRDSIPSCATPTDQLYFYNIPCPLATRSIYLYYRNSPKYSLTAQAFLEFMRTELAEHELLSIPLESWPL